MNLKTVAKLSTIVSVALFLLAIGFYAFMRLDVTRRNNQVNLFSLVPASCVGVLETDDMTTFLNQLSVTNYNRQLEHLCLSGLFDFVLGGLTEYTMQNAHGLSSRMNRMAVSFHQPGGERDQVVYFRVNGDDSKIVENMLMEYAPTDFSPRQEKYRDKTIWVYPLADGDFLSVYSESGFFVVSYQKNLIEKVIDAVLDETSLMDVSGGREIFESKNTHYLRLFGKEVVPFLNRNHCWSEYAFHMNSDVMYLTGEIHASDGTWNETEIRKRLAEVEVVWQPDSLLLSSVPDSTRYYMGQVYDRKESLTHSLFDECVSNLSNEADFSLVVDMNKVADNPSRFQPYLPSFILENASLLRSFILSVQFMLTEGSNPSYIWVFTYKD